MTFKDLKSRLYNFCFRQCNYYQHPRALNSTTVQRCFLQLAWLNIACPLHHAFSKETPLAQFRQPFIRLQSHASTVSSAFGRRQISCNFFNSYTSVLMYYHNFTILLYIWKYRHLILKIRKTNFFVKEFEICAAIFFNLNKISKIWDTVFELVKIAFICKIKVALTIKMKSLFFQMSHFLHLQLNMEIYVN